MDLDTLKDSKICKGLRSSRRVRTLYTCYRGRKEDFASTPQELQEQPFVVFGMRACDVTGVEVLDKVFLADPVDTLLCGKTRARHDRDRMACHEPEDILLL